MDRTNLKKSKMKVILIKNSKLSFNLLIIDFNLISTFIKVSSLY